ncbi:MAG: threonylcarbamoyl-AMP synthase [Proteobacteria bacterium]|nr:threonylcarbamoyl-AMP synthase [Pseudomonadota bacterium]MBU1650251.1 threonylcarbamoyl-AMP synthase [Pseudomonadota bacterium]MBU1986858.1 threonylcarbamoyl-AMP synthase [Pseudomonadota bacterium]
MIHGPSDEDFRRAVSVLEQGGIVAFPTETFYGLAVDPFNEKALTDLFNMKGRSLHKPFLVLIQDESQLSDLASSIPHTYRPLMKAFWPGPLTLVFPAVPGLSSLLTGESGGIGVRISPHPVAGIFGRMWGRPMTATSANLSGMPAARTAEEVQRYFGDGVSCILDGGKTPGGMSSTVVGVEQGKLQLIRAGVIDFSSLLQVTKADA